MRDALYVESDHVMKWQLILKKYIHDKLGITYTTNSVADAFFD